MDSPTIIVVAVDAWRASSLGAYGNTWYGTPELDRVASQSLVYEQVLAESNSLAKVYDSLWTGQHLLDRTPLAGGVKAAPSLTERLREEGYASELVTDEAAVAQHQLASGFDRVNKLDSTSTLSAVDALSTSFAKVLEAAANVAGEWSSEYEQPRLLWIHLRGFTSEWDAPGEFAESLVDEDDPELDPTLEVPHGELDDPNQADDEAFLASCRYAGQVMALDQCWGAFDRLLGELWPQTPPHVVLCGTRGFELGEHNTLGFSGGGYSQQYHVPLMVREPNGPALQRDHRLRQSSDLFHLLASKAIPKATTPPTRLLAAGEADGGDQFLRTEAWHYITSENIGGQSTPADAPRLFVKPDDIWEANDVASLCMPEISQIAQINEELRQLAKAGKPWAAISLSPETNTSKS